MFPLHQATGGWAHHAHGRRNLSNLWKILALISLLTAVYCLAQAREDDFAYPGREPEASWRQAAQYRIEQYRKANIEVLVLDSQGRPVPDADVRFEMLRHAFRFGTAVRPERLIDPSSTQQPYRENFLRNFNSATLPKFYDFQWSDEKVAEKSRKVAVDAIDWLKRNDKAVHGHVLVWNIGKGAARSTEALETEVTRARVARHFQLTIGDPAFAETVDRWDVLNEASRNNEVFELLGRAEAVQWFKEARRLAPAAGLVINETHLCSRTFLPGWPAALDSTEELVHYLQDSGAPVQALGLQSHQIEHLPSIPQVIETLQRLERLGLELMVTEFDMRLTPSPGSTWSERWRSPLPKPAAPEMEQLEADYLRDYLTACFSQPSVTEFTMWGFWDGDHWLHNSPMFRQDWSLKPAGRVWQELTQKTWWTHTTKKTDRGGTCAIRGFLGDYRIVVTAGENEVEVPLNALDHRETARVTIQVDQE